MTEYFVDAHALIWHLEGNPKLGQKARAILGDPSAKLLLPTITLSEACRVVAKGRTAIADWRAVIHAVRSDSRVQVKELNIRVVELAMTLGPSFELHDSLLMASAILHQSITPVALLTVDQTIVSSGLIPIVW